MIRETSPPGSWRSWDWCSTSGCVSAGSGTTRSEPWKGIESGAMAVEGTLDLFKLPEILQLVSQQKKTGILTVQGQQDIVAISFLNGGIVAADALNHTLEEGLGQVLVGEGLLSASSSVWL